MTHADQQFEIMQKSLDDLIKLKTSKGETFYELNEAQTRFGLLDDFIANVMMWPKGCTVVEDRTEHDEDFADYVLKDRDGKNRLILEAKRTSIGFNVPADASINGRKVLASRLKTSKDSSLRALYGALSQAVGYARLKSAPYVMVSNGFQFAICKAVSEVGVEELGHVLFFSSLEDIHEQLERFRSLVSFDELTLPLNQFDLELGKKSLPISSGLCLCAQISDYPRAVHSDLHEQLEEALYNLRMVCGSFFLQLNQLAAKSKNLAEFLTECYVRPSEHNREEFDGFKLGKTFTPETARSLEVQLKPATTMRGVSREILNFMYQEPIVILGNVGVGKSIFIDRLITEDTEISEEAYVARVKFTDYATFHTNDVHASLAKELYEAFSKGGWDLRAFVRDLFAEEIEGMRSSYAGLSEDKLSEKIGDFLEDRKSDLVALVKRAIQYNRMQPSRKKVMVFLDDIDQKSPGVQNEIYALARQIMFEWGVDLSWITMTPSAYHSTSSSNLRGPKTTGHSTVFTVIAPPISAVLEKRIAFVQRLIKQRRMNSYGFHVQPDNQSVDDFLRVLKASFQPNQAVGNLVSNIAGDDVRHATEVVKHFVESENHVILRWNNVKKAYDVLPRIDYDTFLKSILCGERVSDYVDSNEDIVNLFAVYEHTPSEHFLRIGILSYLKSNGSYHSVKSIIQHCEQYGYSSAIIVKHLSELSVRHLIESIDLKNADFGTVDFNTSFRIRQRGLFHLELLGSALYLREVLKVTPIFYREEKFVLDATDTTLSVQNKNLKKFINYLTSVRDASMLGEDFIPSELSENIIGVLDLAEPIRHREFATRKDPVMRQKSADVK